MISFPSLLSGPLFLLFFFPSAFFPFLLFLPPFCLPFLLFVSLFSPPLPLDILSHHKIACLEQRRDDAKKKYRTHRQAYVNHCLGRPLEKLSVSSHWGRSDWAVASYPGCFQSIPTPIWIGWSVLLHDASDCKVHTASDRKTGGREGLETRL